MAKAVPFAVLLLLVLAGCSNEKKNDAAKKIETKKPSKPLLTKLEVKDTKVGTGAVAENGDRLFMLYKGSLADDTVFDTTENRDNKPFSFVLGAGEVIKGWDEGLLGMKVGGRRTIGIPWLKGYGEAGSPPTIPPKSDLYFDVELLDLAKSNEIDITRNTLQPGVGRAIKKGDTVSVKYVGTLVGKTVFDEKYKDKPYTFKVGDPKIRDFINASVEGMKKGGKYKLRIPPDAGFGPMGGPNVEPNQILYYDMTVVDVK